MSQVLSRDVHITHQVDLLSLMFCFSKNNRLSLHHYSGTDITKTKFKRRPPPKACRDRFHKIMDNLPEFLSYDPFSALVIAQLHLSVGQSKAAIQTYKLLLKAHPEIWEARYALGLVYAQLKQRQNAIETFK